MLNEHDSECSLRVVDGGKGEGGAVDGYVAFRDQVGEEGRTVWCGFGKLEEKTEGVAVWNFRDESGGCVDVAL